MWRKALYFLLAAVAIITLAYYLQPNKKGSGLDPSVQYEQVEDWLHLPDSMVLGNATGLSFDTSGNLVVFCRATREWPLLGPMPEEPIPDETILIINKDSGTVLNAWGDHLFIMPHGLKVDKDDNIWVTDVGLHQVFKFSHNGQLLMKLGEAGISGCDSAHFDQPTDVAIANDGAFYIADGYGNSRIVKYAASGRYLFQWGRKGNKEGEFDIPHSIAIGEAQHVYVADRENDRIQIFDSSGNFIKQYNDHSLAAVCGVAFDNAASKLYAVDDWSFMKIKHLGSDVIVFDGAGNTQTRFGRTGFYKGKTSWYHAIAVDKEKNVYVADILNNAIQKFSNLP